MVSSSARDHRPQPEYNSSSRGKLRRSSIGRNDMRISYSVNHPDDAPDRRSYTTVMTKPTPGFNLPELLLDDPPPPTQPTRVTKPNTETVVLRGVRVPLNSDVGGAFITDLSRNKERLFSDAQVIEKYDISETDWTAI